MNTYTDNEDIFRDTFSIDPAVQDIVTNLSYSYSENYAKNYFIAVSQKEDAVAIADHKIEYEGEIEFTWVRDEATADAIAQKTLDQRKYAPMIVSFNVHIHMMLNDLADDITVYHFNDLNLNDITITSLDVDLDNLLIIVSGKPKT